MFYKTLNLILLNHNHHLHLNFLHLAVIHFNQRNTFYPNQLLIHLYYKLRYEKIMKNQHMEIY
jgi:hypothetical protein